MDNILLKDTKEKQVILKSKSAHKAIEYYCL